MTRPCRRFVPLLCLLSFAGLVAACGPGALAGADSSADSREIQTFAGEYQWSQGGDGELTAEFRPTADNQWKVKFRFQFNGKAHNWKGTATGSLRDGSQVQGTAKGGGGRQWTFDGRIVEGVLTAKHAESIDGSLSNTGSFVIQRQ